MRSLTMGFVVALAIIVASSAAMAGVPCAGTSSVSWSWGGVGDTAVVSVDTIDVNCIIRDCYGQPLGNRVCTFYSDRGDPYDDFVGNPATTDLAGIASVKATTDSMGEVHYYVFCEGLTLGPTLRFYWCTAAGIFDRPGEIPGSFDLWPGYPNPFRDVTDLSFAMPADAHVSVQVYDVQGRGIRTITDQNMTAGYHTIRWDGCDSRGRRAAPGIYYAVMATDRFSKSTKMILVQ